MRKKIHLTKSARFINLFLISLLIYQLSYGQTQSILVQSSITPAQLNSGQLAKFNKLSASPLNDNFVLVEVQNLANCQANGKIRLALPNLPCSDMLFTATAVNYISESNYYWYGTIVSDVDAPCQGGTLILMAKEGEKFGTIVFDDYSYEFQDLGGGIQSLSRYKIELTGEHECGVDSTTSGNRTVTPPSVRPQTNNNPQANNRITPCIQTDCYTVRVLVLWTQNAANIEANINDRIAMAIAQTNQAYANSQIWTIQLFLAASQLINFTESNDIQADVNTLANNATVQALRNAAQADLVVLLTHGNYPGYNGIVQAIGPNFNGAYAIVETNAATNGRYVFAHEVGHLFGARHDNDPAGTIEHGYSFNTGWFIFTKHRYTLVTSSPGNKTRELYYSNPEVSIKNKPTGTWDHNNNAQLHRNTGCTVASFFVNNPATALNIDIIQGNPNVCCTNVTAEADVYCGTPPYYFNWLISYDGINWALLPNSEIVNFNSDCDKTTLIIELAVTDAHYQFQRVTRYYNADCSQTVRTPKKPEMQGIKSPEIKEFSKGKEFLQTEVSSQIVERVFPNPSSSTVQAELNLSTAENLRIEIIDASGNIRKLVLNTHLPKGKRTLTLNTDDLHSGIYQLRVVSKNKTEYHNFIVIK